jgi:CBS domain containing-hemolysin-like protein
MGPFTQKMEVAMKSYSVKDLMVPLSEYATVSEGEYVSEDATLDVAIHQIIMGHHQSLLVTGDGKIVGILRLTDVFAALFHKMKECFE